MVEPLNESSGFFHEQNSCSSIRKRRGLMRVFLTGATGFIGSHVARELLKKGHEVHALIRRGSGVKRIADIEQDLHRIEGDLFSDLAPVLSQVQPELAIHLAWYCVPGDYQTSPLNAD